MTRFNLSIGGVRIRVSAEGPFPAGFIGPRLEQFRSEEPFDGRADVEVSWRNADPSGTALGELIFAPGSVWRLYRSPDGDGLVAVISYAHRGELNADAAVVEADRSWRVCRVTENARVEPWHSLLNLGAGELIVRTRLVLDGGLMFHATAVDDAGRGILMVGHSGAGKSTQSTIWVRAGATVLSDDRIAVRPCDGVFTAFGSPWGGTADIARNASVPLRTILVLEQAPTNELVPVSPDAAMGLLLARSFLPYWDAELLGCAMDTAARLVDAVPVRILRCRPDDSVIPVVRSIL